MADRLGGLVGNGAGVILGSQGQRRVSGVVEREGRGEPRVVAVEAVCAIHKERFALIFERSTLGVWRAVLGVRLDGAVDLGNLGATGSEPVPRLSKAQIEGRIEIGSEYVGCAWCLDQGLFRCGCGALNCKGAVRPHESHHDQLCGGCDQWRCLDGGTSTMRLEGYAGFNSTAHGLLRAPRELPRPTEALLPRRGMRLLSDR